ncbi:hypothetical protein EG68_08545 [Paragonimus skrjabini miyazakii]|uniref:Uncharacterized protein n=1 Tax=Paragonimus skrjabini miyazakii TaxID=59628 RepID=A0A8S9YKI8_9TREM|nr:hypothetical protein EG68_08545 [Paragonimus skrjabini miyazakii]
MKSGVWRSIWNCNGVRQLYFLLASSLVILIFYYWMQNKSTLYTLVIYRSKNRLQNRTQEDPFWKLFEKVNINFTCENNQGLGVLRQISSHVVNLLPTTLYAVVQGQISRGPCTSVDIYTEPWNFSIGLGHNNVTYWLRFPYPSSTHPTDDPLTQLNGTRISISLARVLPIPVTDFSEMRTCMMAQNCLHWVDELMPCGVQPLNRSALFAVNPQFAAQWSVRGGWPAFSSYLSETCDKTGTGEILLQWNGPVWFVPCSDCAQESTCNWSEAKWYRDEWPERCIYNTLSVREDTIRLTQYLKSKVLIFVGDSTLRGLANSLIETINRKHPRAIETHGQVTVTNVGCVSLRYAYYPLFNRELDKQATFMDHVRALSETPSPAHEVIIIVGGVLWLNATLLDELYEFITSKEFSGRFLKTRVIIKDHAAGFHSPISGLPSPSMTSRMGQAKANNELITRAKQYGWTVLHSYDVTWTRVDHFVAYARCSCHFYQIQQKFTSAKKAVSFTVIGPIHHVLFRLFQQSILYGTPT